MCIKGFNSEYVTVEELMRKNDYTHEEFGVLLLKMSGAKQTEIDVFKFNYRQEVIKEHPLFPNHLKDLGFMDYEVEKRRLDQRLFAN